MAVEMEHRRPNSDETAIRDLVSFTARLKEFALAHGCDLVGVAPVDGLAELDSYPQWLEAGYAGEMEYLHHQLPKRLNPRQILPEVRSVVVIGVVYHTDQPLSTEIDDSSRGWISRYAWGKDYHEVLSEKLQTIHAFLSDEFGTEYHGRFYVDTGPILDRVFAKYAGLGWFGKNTNLINQQLGSWFFIGELLTNLPLVFDSPPPDRCGTCRRCIEACPTDAIIAPYLLDSNRCISYLTIELRSQIPDHLRPQMGNHLFGCDICQDVCPWNRKAALASNTEFEPKEGMVAPRLEEIAQLDEQEFRRRFRSSPVKRAKWRGLMRNLLVAAGNSGSQENRHIAERFLDSPDSTLAEMARWACDRLDEATEEVDGASDGLKTVPGKSSQLEG